MQVYCKLFSETKREERDRKMLSHLQENDTRKLFHVWYYYESMIVLQYTIYCLRGIGFTVEVTAKDYSQVQEGSDTIRYMTSAIFVNCHKSCLIITPVCQRLKLEGSNLYHTFIQRSIITCFSSPILIKTLITALIHI